jgi:hypothetical protein
MEPQCCCANAVDLRSRAIKTIKPMMRSMTGRDMREPRFAVLLALAFLFIALHLAIRLWGSTADALGDTDDAMRLVEVRDFLAGQGWFDLHQPRLAPPLGYDSHWSRLIDAGLAGLFLLFHQFVDAGLAERLMRVTWPMLWLVPTILGTLATAWRLAGRNAVVVTLLFVVGGGPAFQQFLPGRIDHHNVQIAFAVLTLAATVWSDRLRWAAWAAGALTGLALAIGLESLLFLALCGAAFAVRYVLDRAEAGALARYGAALAVSTVAAFLVSVPPAHWSRSACDAIAINWAAPVFTAGGLLALAAGLGARAEIWIRGATVAAIAAAAAAIFVAVEPRCLGGPYAMMDPAVRPIWFDHVSEMRSIWAVAREAPAMAAAVAISPLAALAAAAWLAGERALRRDPAYVTAAAVLLASCVLTIAVTKMCMYAMWLGMPLLAAACLRLFARLRLTSLVARTFVALLLTPALLSGSLIAVAEAAGTSALDEQDPRVAAGCLKTASYAPLARLPRGLVAADTDFGSFVLATTAHSVLSAPYHRLSDGIVAAHRILALPPDEAHAVVSRLGVDYVLICRGSMPVGMTEEERKTGLWARLRDGSAPSWLEAVPPQPGEAFRIYRVIKGRR